MKRLALLTVFVLTACIPPSTPERPECGHARLLEIEAKYLAAILTACDGHTLEACPAAPAIERDFTARREEWIACR